MTDMVVAMATAIEPPAPVKSRNKRKPAAILRRGPPRPYKKLAAELLETRIKRLTDRLERVKRQHESARLQLTKYAHEQFYRERDAIQNARQEEPAPPGPPPLDASQIAPPPV
jgi:hypothetical protein